MSTPMKSLSTNSEDVFTPTGDSFTLFSPLPSSGITRGSLAPFRAAINVWQSHCSSFHGISLSREETRSLPWLQGDAAPFICREGTLTLLHRIITSFCSILTEPHRSLSADTLFFNVSEQQTAMGWLSTPRRQETVAVWIMVFCVVSPWSLAGTYQQYGGCVFPRCR